MNSNTGSFEAPLFFSVSSLLLSLSSSLSFSPLSSLPFFFLGGKAEGTRLTAASYNPALKAAADAGDWMVAISAIDVMTKAALTDKETGPDVVSFNYAMSACAKAGESEVRQ